ncbi:hypothetical protein [Thauera sp.]|jgi:hypothetical protein|uniref:hypothetical protein n=1 Tax=Thauera sp. TaxID=1905334 RepID=UPI002A36926D|nr:hypothetical protein [Thauera sp.]MDX9886788.1 hypothetical protein [Thauera sp.]
MSPTDAAGRPPARDVSAGECCAQAQMASYARLEAARRAPEQAASGPGRHLLRVLARVLRIAPR